MVVQQAENGSKDRTEETINRLLSECVDEERKLHRMEKQYSLNKSKLLRCIEERGASIWHYYSAQVQHETARDRHHGYWPTHSFDDGVAGRPRARSVLRPGCCP